MNIVYLVLRISGLQILIMFVDVYGYNMEHIGHVVRMSVFFTQRFIFRRQYVVSLSKTLHPRCFNRLSCEMSSRWGHPREGCSVL